MFQDISVEQLLAMQNKKEIALIDVRSPSEYADSTIPGSANIPLFDDAERAEIGTLYKQVSVQAAKERGLEIVSAKLPAFIKTFAAIKGEKAVFCWRGGMRSRTTATVLWLMGIRAYRLSGGVRAYRKWVVSTLEEMSFAPPAFVINGNTGSGKTEILRRLRQEGLPVLDLEGLAGHRGSIFGEIGLKSHNQKTFESLIVTELLKLQGAPFVLMEGESKRIGKAVLPYFIVEKKMKGTQIIIEMPLEERIRHIMEDYRPWEHHEEVVRAFEHIKRRIHTPAAKEIEESLAARSYERVVELLLEHYYDPRYAHAAEQYEQEPIRLHVRNIGEAVEAVKRELSAATAAGASGRK